MTSGARASGRRRHLTRGAVIHARYRVLLVADDPDLERLAADALDHALGLVSAVDRAGLNARADECQAAVERFIRAARRRLGLRGDAVRPASRSA